MSQPIRPMLGEIELQQAQLIQLDEDQVLTRHDIPALEGDFLQRLGRAGAAIELTGIQSGTEARAGLGELREAFRAASPLTFAADIVTATELEDVLIEHFEISEHSGLPDCYEYRLRLREYTEAPETDPETPPRPIEPPVVEEDEGVLIVNVVKEGDPAFDGSGVDVTLTGDTEAGERFTNRPLTNRDGTRWTEDPFPTGSYTIQANAPGAAADGSDLSGTTSATVRAGETTEVTITLRDAAALALRFLVHFRFDSAFVEPCLKHVLKQVAEFAAANPDMRLLPVGHTDLTGSEAYNQSLSERRARSVFAVLRFGNDRQRAIDEWNELRQRRTPGTTRSLNDSWGAREYQQMLQDRGFYNGRIDGIHGSGTDAAVREFQAARSLPVTGSMNGATWPRLIEDYLGADALSVPDDRFLPNCPGEILQWLGCGELDPLRDVTFAWRPNRRTELLFTRATVLPADVVEPDTFNLPSPGAVAGGWCLNDSSAGSRTCFAAPMPGGTRHETCPGTLPRGEPLTRQPAEPSPSFDVQGSIRFADGTPYQGDFFVTAPDGQYMSGEQRDTVGSVRAGTPTPDQPQADGSFAYPGNPKTPGIFIMEIDDDVVARVVDAPLEEAKGPVVCKRLAAASDRFDVILVSRAVAAITPRITGPQAVVVRRAHTNPARQPLTLSVNTGFTGSGTLSIRQGTGRIRIFDAAAGGNEITFNGTDNVFTAAQLAAGHTVFVEGGPDPSAAVNDVEITLQVTVNASPGLTALHQMTSVRVTLDVAQDRQVPMADPPILSEAQKINPGRMLLRQTPRFDARRALILARRAEPRDFAGQLSLAPINARVGLFGPTDETPAAGQTALTTPQVFANSAVPETAPPLLEPGQRFFAEGQQTSLAARDTGFQLGLDGIEPDGDRVAITVNELAFVQFMPPPLDTIPARVQVEGVLNSARAGFGIAALFTGQIDQLFQLRAVLPAETAPFVMADLTSRAADNSLIETIPVRLDRRAPGIYSSSLPLLAIPHVIPRTAIAFAAPQSLEIIRARAQGSLSFALQAPRTAIGRVSTPVRGRVVELNVGILSSSGVTNAEVTTHLTTTNNVWSQGGVEFRLVGGAVTNVADPGGLDQIEALPANFFVNLGTERTTLFGLNQGAANQIDLYFVAGIVGNRGEGFAPNDLNAPMAAFRGSIVMIAGVSALPVMPHEVGHVLMNLPRTVNAGGDEHRLFTLSAAGVLASGAAAPNTNVMFGGVLTGGEVNMTEHQCRRAFASTFMQVLG